MRVRLFLVVLFFNKNNSYFDKFFGDEYKFFVGENLFNLNEIDKKNVNFNVREMIKVIS